ncbi:hypothetical protein AABB24_019554 [Solanum stoloniferum]|uniref:Uncharacterized protein n=1 Tax=Solanum stoloniferum TaxID=62892 RepID=A0ABD2TIQ4_9SOLN
MMGKCLIIVQEVLLVSLVGLRQSLIDKCVYKDSVRTLWMGSMEVNQSFMELYGRNVFLKVGNGNKIKFWRDGWIDQIPLSESFPDLFSICNNPEARVCECWTTQGWDLIFRRLMNDWEVDRVASFLGKLGETNLVTNAPDRVIWKHSKDDKFTVNNAYEKGIQVGVRMLPSSLEKYFNVDPILNA